MNKITNEQALQNIVIAARLAKLSADEHELIIKCYEKLKEAITPGTVPSVVAD
jgi:hypothetical protein